MKRFIRSAGLLILGAIVCFGIGIAIVYLGIMPKLQVLEPSSAGRFPWRQIILPLLLSVGWWSGGMLAAFLFVRRRSELTGHVDGEARPWLARRQWASSEVNSDILPLLLGSWILVLVSISLNTGFYILARDLVANGDYKPLMILVPFIFAGLGMLIPAVNLVRNLRRFGRVSLTLNPHPGSIGGQVGGLIDVNLPYDPRHFFLITLDCEHSWKARHGQKSYGSKIVWQKEGLAHAEASMKGTRLSFRFDVPDNLPSSSPESFDYHTWHVQLTARLPGADLHRGFEIPVFPTGQSANNIRYNSTNHPDYPKFRMAEALSTFKVSKIDDGEVILKYAMFYRKKLTAGLILLSVGLGCGLPGIAILLDELNGVGMAFSLVGLVFFLIGFYVLFHHLVVRLNSEELQTTVKIMGIPIRRKNVSRDEIKYLGLIMGNWIAAYTKNGRPMTISTTFSDPGTAQKALEAICKLTGLSAQKKK